jgi:O-acetyl-ADP-ribose deacetylase (regulator of RNase III)
MAMEVEVFAGSVLEPEADGVVNAANTQLRHGGGVAAAIARAAGPEFVRASDAIGHCPLGQAVATAAGRLRARVVIHVPTVDYTAAPRRTATASELRQGVAAALRLAHAHGCRTLALPILGAGVAGLPAVTACRLMAEGFALAAAEGATPERLIVCAFTEADRAAAATVWGPPQGPVSAPTGTR